MPVSPSSLLKTSLSPLSGGDGQLKPVEKSVLTNISLRKNAAWMFAGRGIYFACQFGILAVLATLASPEIVGQFVLALAVCNPIFIFASLQLHVAQCTDVSGEYSFRDYLLLRTITSLLSIFLICVLTGIVCDSWLDVCLVFAMALAKCIESFCDIYCGRMQKYEQMFTVAMSLMLRGITAFLALALTIYVTGNVAWGVLAMGLGWLGVLIFHDAISVKRSVRFDTRRSTNDDHSAKRIRRLAILTFPLGLMAGFCALEANLPRYIVQGVFGTHELGVLGVMAYIAMAGNTVISAIGMAAIPRLASLYGNQEKRTFQILSCKLFATGICIGLLVVLFSILAGQSFLRVVFGEEYAAHSQLLVVMSLVAALQYGSTMLSVSMRSIGLFRTALLAHLVSLISTILACVLIVDFSDLLSVGYALLLAAFMTLIVFTVLLLRQLRVATSQVSLGTFESQLAEKVLV